MIKVGKVKVCHAQKIDFVVTPPISTDRLTGDEVSTTDCRAPDKRGVLRIIQR